MLHLAGIKSLKFASINNAVFNIVHTLWSDCQGLTLTPLLTPTVDTTHCNVVFIVCMKTSQYMWQCDTGSGDVQKSTIWGLRTIGGNGDEIEISTVSTTDCPVHGNVHSSTDIFREANTREGGY